MAGFGRSFGLRLRGCYRLARRAWIDFGYQRPEMSLTQVIFMDGVMKEKDKDCCGWVH